MKKRKSPILLLTFVIVLIVGAALINMSNQSRELDSHDHGAEAEAEAPRQVQATGNQQPSIKTDMAKSLGRPAQAEGPGGAPGPSQPTVKVDKAPPYIPKPNENMTSGQWYTDESAKTNKPKGGK